MIKRIICAIFGHKKCKSIENLLPFYSKYKDEYIFEGKMYHCPRCKERIFAGKGVLLIEAIDIAHATLQDLRDKNWKLK